MDKNSTSQKRVTKSENDRIDSKLCLDISIEKLKFAIHKWIFRFAEKGLTMQMISIYKNMNSQYIVEYTHIFMVRHEAYWCSRKSIWLQCHWNCVLQSICLLASIYLYSMFWPIHFVYIFEIANECITALPFKMNRN